MEFSPLGVEDERSIAFPWDDDAVSGPLSVSLCPPVLLARPQDMPTSCPRTSSERQLTEYTGLFPLVQLQ